MKSPRSLIIFTLLLVHVGLRAQLASSGKNKVAFNTFKSAEKKFYKGNLRGGEATFERSAQKYEDNGDVNGYIAAKAMEAIVLLNKNKPKEAFRAFRKAEELYDEQPVHNEATRAYLRLCLGKYHLYYNEQKEATSFLKEAEKVSDNNPDLVSPIFNIELQQSMGELYLKKGDKQTALDFYDELIEASKNLPAEDQNDALLNDFEQMASSLLDEVLTPKESAKRYKEMLVNADSSRHGTLNLKTGRSLYQYTEYETAYSHLEKALEYDLPPAEEAETKSMLATIVMSINDYEDALEKNGEALALQIAIDAPPKVIYQGLMKQGEICSALDVVGKTVYWYKKTVKNIPDDWTLEMELSNYNLLPIEHLNQPELSENFSVALLNFERAGRLIAKLPTKERIVARIEVDMAKGALYFTAHNFEQAQKYFEEALSLMPSIYTEKNALIAQVTRYLADIAHHYKKHDLALDYINRSINAAMQSSAPLVQGDELPNMDMVNDRYELLYSLISKSAIQYELYCNRPNLAEEDISIALQTSDLAMQLLVKLRASYRSEGARYELSELSENINHLAIQIVSKLYSLESKQEYLYALFRYIENSKSSLLLQAVQQLRAQKVSGVPEWVVEKENKLKVNIAYLSGEIYYETKQGKDLDKKRLEALELELEDAEKKYPAYLEYIEKSYPDYYNMKYKQKVISCQDLQKRMADNDLLINYVLVDSFVHILVIDDKQVAYHYVPMPNRLNTSIPKYIRSLKGDKPDDFLKYSNVLYEALIKPIRSYIDGQNMIFMPDGVLNYIPFELLPTEELSQSLSKGKKDYSMYKKIPYLIKKGPIAYNYSSTLYLEAKEHDFSDVPEGFMGFAPDFSKVESFELTKRHQQSKYQDLLLSPLENAAIEVKMIGELTKGSTHIGFDAKESVFKREASKYGVLHFATHGILNHKYPLYSSLVMLSDDEGGNEDGLLHTYELYNMNINAELVALSACNTGVGAIQKGEGTMSVARGFAYAGCPNIAMTLWPVSDQATQILMENFYVNLMQGMPKAEALQKAKLKFIESGSGFICVPFFWSGLILVGTPDQLHSLQILSSGLSTYAWIGIAIAVLLALVALFFFIKKRN